MSLASGILHCRSPALSRSFSINVQNYPGLFWVPPPSSISTKFRANVGTPSPHQCPPNKTQDTVHPHPLACCTKKKPSRGTPQARYECGCRWPCFWGLDQTQSSRYVVHTTLDLQAKNLPPAEPLIEHASFDVKSASAHHFRMLSNLVPLGYSSMKPSCNNEPLRPPSQSLTRPAFSAPTGFDTNFESGSRGLAPP